MFRTGYILNRRDDWVWFIALPFVAVAIGLASQRWLSAIAVVSFSLLLLLCRCCFGYPGTAPIVPRLHTNASGSFGGCLGVLSCSGFRKFVLIYDRR